MTWLQVLDKLSRTSNLWHGAHNGHLAEVDSSIPVMVLPDGRLFATNGWAAAAVARYHCTRTRRKLTPVEDDPGGRAYPKFVATWFDSALPPTPIRADQVKRWAGRPPDRLIVRYQDGREVTEPCRTELVAEGIPFNAALVAMVLAAVRPEESVACYWGQDVPFVLRGLGWAAAVMGLRADSPEVSAALVSAGPPLFPVDHEDVTR